MATDSPLGTRYVALYDYVITHGEDLISVRRGDKLEKTADGNGEWVYVKLLTHSEDGGGGPKEGYFPANYVSEIKDLHGEDWYAGKLSRSAASRILSTPPNGTGSFLVRDSEAKGGYSLSVQRDGATKHYIIKEDDYMNYYLWRSETFHSITELVEYYKHTDTSPGPLLTPYTSSTQNTTRSQVTRKVSSPREVWEIDRNTITLLERLGGGQFGEVKRGQWNDLVDVAVKQMNADTMQVEEFRREAETMQRLRHPRLILLYGVCTTPADEPVLIVTELMEGGALLDHLKERKAQRNLHTTQELITMGSQVASGMAYLEEEGIVHRDLAARNVLVDEARKNVKIADFGLARVLQENIYERNTTLMLPVRWMAPEAIFEGVFSSKSDVWSFGIFLFELVTHGSKPYGSRKNTEVKELIQKGEKLPQMKHCPSSLYSVMQRCWEYAPCHRPSFAEVKEDMKELLDCSTA